MIDGEAKSVLTLRRRSFGNAVFFQTRTNPSLRAKLKEHKTLKEAVVDTKYTHYNIYKHYRKVFNLSRCLIFFI